MGKYERAACVVMQLQKKKYVRDRQGEEAGSVRERRRRDGGDGGEEEEGRGGSAVPAAVPLFKSTPLFWFLSLTTNLCAQTQHRAKSCQAWLKLIIQGKQSRSHPSCRMEKSVLQATGSAKRHREVKKYVCVCKRDSEECPRRALPSLGSRTRAVCQRNGAQCQKRRGERESTQAGWMGVEIKVSRRKEEKVKNDPLSQMRNSSHPEAGTKYEERKREKSTRGKKNRVIYLPHNSSKIIWSVGLSTHTQ